MIGKTLDEGSTFDRVGSRQLAGLLIAAWSVLFLERFLRNLLSIVELLHKQSPSHCLQ